MGLLNEYNKTSFLAIQCELVEVKSSPSLSWAWPSSAPACFYILINIFSQPFYNFETLLSTTGAAVPWFLQPCSPKYDTPNLSSNWTWLELSLSTNVAWQITLDTWQLIICDFCIVQITICSIRILYFEMFNSDCAIIIV